MQNVKRKLSCYSTILDVGFGYVWLANITISQPLPLPTNGTQDIQRKISFMNHLQINWA